MKAGSHVPEHLNLLGTMGNGTIPYNEDGAVKLLQKVFQKGDHQVCVDVGVGMKTKEQTKSASGRGYAEGRNDRYLGMGAGSVIQQWRPASRAPGSAGKGRHHHAALVDEDQPGLQPECFFLIRGHSTLTHCPIPCSSRSAARRSGFWGLHPSIWRRRPTWST